MTDQVEQNKGELLPENSNRVAMLNRLEALGDKMIAVGQGADFSKPVADMSLAELEAIAKLNAKPETDCKIKGSCDYCYNKPSRYLLKVAGARYVLCSECYIEEACSSEAYYKATILEALPSYSFEKLLELESSPNRFNYPEWLDLALDIELTKRADARDKANGNWIVEDRLDISEIIKQERIEARLDMLEAIVKYTVAIGLILATGYYLAKLVETLV